MSELFHDIRRRLNTNAIVDKIELLDLKRNILLPNFLIPQEYKIHTQDEKPIKAWCRQILLTIAQRSDLERVCHGSYHRK